tara:strand:+ start:9076 stop:9282 length:207 start_codon:yes stop_codon:yes gene_type:complete
MSKKNSWWTLIKFLLDFFKGRKEAQQEAQKENEKETIEDLKNEYNKVDEEKQESHTNELHDSLNNHFK